MKLGLSLMTYRYVVISGRNDEGMFGPRSKMSCAATLSVL